MESSEFEFELDDSETEGFDLNDLLVGEHDDFLEAKRIITIEVESVVDEDGDDAFTMGIRAVGFDSEDLILVLSLAQQLVEERFEDDDEEDDDEEDEDE